MLPQAATLFESKRTSDSRGETRRSLALGYEADASSSGKRVLILNLSRSGMLLQTNAPLFVGEVLSIELPEIGTVQAKIVRANGDRFGTQFLSPVSQAVVSAVVLGSPAIQPSSTDSEPIYLEEGDLQRKSAPEWLLFLVSLLAFAAIVGLLYVFMFLSPTGFG